MRLVAFLIATTIIATPTFAESVQRSSNPQGVQIDGNADIKATQEGSAAVAQGEGNTAKSSAGAIKSGTQIQGDTKIQASQKNSTAVATGKGNTAENQVGMIGGK